MSVAKCGQGIYVLFLICFLPLYYSLPKPLYSKLVNDINVYFFMTYSFNATGLQAKQTKVNPPDIPEYIHSTLLPVVM